MSGWKRPTSPEASNGAAASASPAFELVDLPPPDLRLTPAEFLASAAFRRLLLQILVYGVLAGLVAASVLNALQNIRALGMTTGFGFLERPASFELDFKTLDYAPGNTYARAALVALSNTIFIALISVVIATALGFTLGIARLSRSPLLRGLSLGYIEITRNIPLLLFVYIWYFGAINALPETRTAAELFETVFLSNRGLAVPFPDIGTAQTVGMAVLALLLVTYLFLRSRLRRAVEAIGRPERLSQADLGALIVALAGFVVLGALATWDHPRRTNFGFRGGAVVAPESVALIIALSTYTAAYIAEIVRAGLQSVGEGQREAARSLGLKESAILRLVTIPLALRIMVPPMTNQYMNIVKNSAFGAVIGVPEVFGVVGQKTVNDTGQAMEPVFLVLLIFLALNLLFSLLLNLYNAKLRLK